MDEHAPPVPPKTRTPIAQVVHGLYLRSQEKALCAAGPSGPTWNRNYIAQLAQRGLVLLPSRPPGDRDEWYPHDAPMLAPLPHEEGGDQWPPGTLICWAPQIDLPERLGGGGSDG
jgi:hypothetical protein